MCSVPHGREEGAAEARGGRLMACGGWGVLGGVGCGKPQVLPVSAERCLRRGLLNPDRVGSVSPYDTPSAETLSAETLSAY